MIRVRLGMVTLLLGAVHCTSSTSGDPPPGADAGGTVLSDAGNRDAAMPGDAAMNVPDAAMTPDAALTHQDAGGMTADASIGTEDAGNISTLPDPILFVHGINGGSADWDVMVERFVADGWPRDHLMARSFSNPGWGCNVDNAATLSMWAQELMTATGASRVDVVAHSMGTLSSRHWVKMLGGTAVVNTYVTIAGMNHGLTSPCFSPLNVCVWKELCATGEFITALNAPPAGPPPTQWVAIYSDGDDTVPVDSAPLDGAENIMIPGLEHDGPIGVQNSELVYAQVKRVVQYPGH